MVHYFLIIIMTSLVCGGTINCRECARTNQHECTEFQVDIYSNPSDGMACVAGWV